MVRFHVNQLGEARICKAQPGQCPLGGHSEHYDSLVEARRGYEAKMQAKLRPTGLKKLKKNILEVFGQEPETPSYEPMRVDAFVSMVDMLMSTEELMAPDKALEHAEYNFLVQRVVSGEDTLIPQDFRAVYSRQETVNSTSSLREWTPQSNTQKFIVHTLVQSIVSHHMISLTNAGLRRNRFLETLSGVMDGSAVDLSEEPRESGKIYEYDEGWIAGYADVERRCWTPLGKSKAPKRETISRPA